MMEHTEELWLEGGGVRHVYTDDYVDSLKDEIERLKADAERYRWLRERMDTKDVSIFKMRNDPDPEVDEEVDAAIDAARKGVDDENRTRD